MNPKLIKIIKAGFLLICVFTTVNLNTRWKNEFVMAMAMLKDYPNDPVGYLFGSEILLRLGRFDEAHEALQRGINLGLKDYRTYYYLGVSSAMNLPQSASYFREGILKYPHYGDLYTGLGRALILQKKTEEALPVLRRAVQLSPDYSSFGYLIQCYIMSKDLPQAQEILDRALKVINNGSQEKSFRQLFLVPVDQLPVDLGI